MHYYYKGGPLKYVCLSYLYISVYAKEWVPRVYFLQLGTRLVCDLPLAHQPCSKNSEYYD